MENVFIVETAQQVGGSGLLGSQGTSTSLSAWTSSTWPRQVPTSGTSPPLPLHCGPSGPYGSPSNKLWDFPANGSSTDGGKVIIKRGNVKSFAYSMVVETNSEAEPVERGSDRDGRCRVVQGRVAENSALGAITMAVLYLV